MIFSEINTILPGNWTQIEQPNNAPVIGAWRERQVGTGSISSFILEVFTATGWITKMILTQD